MARAGCSRASSAYRARWHWPWQDIPSTVHQRMQTVSRTAMHRWSSSVFVNLLPHPDCWSRQSAHQLRDQAGKRWRAIESGWRRDLRLYRNQFRRLDPQPRGQRRHSVEIPQVRPPTARGHRSQAYDLGSINQQPAITAPQDRPCPRRLGRNPANRRPQPISGHCAQIGTVE